MVLKSVHRGENATESKLPLKMLPNISETLLYDFLCTTLCSNSKDAEILEQKSLTKERNKKSR